MITLRQVSVGCASVVAVGSAIALLGWALDLRVLQQVIVGAPRMVPNTALGLLALASGLFWSWRGERMARRVAVISAGVATLIGSVSLIEYWLGRDLGIDLLLFASRVEASMASLPGRPSPATAGALTLLGLGQIAHAASWPRWRGRIVDILSVGAAIMGIRAGLGYLYSVAPFYQMSAQTGMAIHTAFGVALIACGQVCAVPEGLVTALTNRSSGSLLARRLVPVSAAALMVVGWGILVGLRAGIYDAAYAVTLFTLVSVILIFGLVLLSAHRLNQIEEQRTEAHRLLAKRHQTLARVERVLRGRTDELESLNRELEAFTSSVSHDLRAPLRQIDGFAQILVESLGPRLSGEDHGHLDRIVRGTRTMRQLIDDLLRLSRVGRQQLRLGALELRSQVDSVIADIEHHVPDRNIEWRVSQLPAVRGDAGLIKQVFVNLLSNAVKFTRDRRPAVIEVGELITETASDGAADSQDGQCTLFVRDNGVGFDAKYADKLFGVFQRLHRVDEFEGTGVGLAIVERVVRRHGGRVWAECIEGLGATFYLTLPLLAPPGPPIEPGPTGDVGV